MLKHWAFSLTQLNVLHLLCKCVKKEEMKRKKCCCKEMDCNTSTQMEMRCKKI